MTTAPTHQTIDRDALAAELEGVSDMLTIIAEPLAEDAEKIISDTTTGNALYGIATHLRRLAADLSDYIPTKPEELGV